MADRGLRNADPEDRTWWVRQLPDPERQALAVLLGVATAPEPGKEPT